MNLKEQKFGIEIEMTGITREQAAEVLADYFNSTIQHSGGGYDTRKVSDASGRNWKIVYDSSITSQKVLRGIRRETTSEYKVEFVSPICTYEDIEGIQEIVRAFRAKGAFVNKSCGIHVHINAEPFEARQLRNLVNIVAAKEDMVYRALQVDSNREEYYCKKISPDFLEKLNRKKPKDRNDFKRLWYNGADGSHVHYHNSRYHCLNLHSVFQKNTIEFRAFNANLHAGKIKAYLQFCMAVTAQAYNQKSASPSKTISSNEKYTFRVWLLRLGMIGDEFKTARTHLLNHLDGNVAWKTPEQAQAQKERLRAKREKECEVEQEHSEGQMTTTSETNAQERREETQDFVEISPETEAETEYIAPSYGMTMSM